MSLNIAENPVLNIVEPEGYFLLHLSLTLGLANLLVVDPELHIHEDIVGVKLGVPLQLHAVAEPVVKSYLLVYLDPKIPENFARAVEETECSSLVAGSTMVLEKNYVG